ncbi:MAG: FHA domain-containing protein [Gemmatimonadaceae bacterium]|nr:FHA domain-containing protein [Gemmatimonadaceae bacterium]
MPFLQLRDSRYPLRAGVNRVGWGPEAEVRLPDSPFGGTPVAAVVTVASEGSASVDLGPGSVVVVLNGVAVQGPSPVLHGDRLVIGEFSLSYGDEAQLGDTIEIEGHHDDSLAVPSPAARTSRVGGRLLSLMDGREYPVPDAGLTIGRDPSCDIVIPAQSVSRRHATIRAGDLGYLLLDTSANGVFVNEGRVHGELPIGRGDTLRVGPEEYRFHADEEATQVDPAAHPGLQHTGAFAAAARPTAPAAGAAGATPVPERERPMFGSLEVINEGPSKGTRYELDSPRITIGRGPHNDVSINDESVSEYHAKLQRREDGWYLIDLDSTNGSYVDGKRVAEEARVGSGSDVRFGGVKMTFRGAGPVARPSGETRVIVGVKAPDPKRAEPRHGETTDQSDAHDAVGGGRISPLLWLTVTVLVILALYAAVRGGGR